MTYDLETGELGVFVRSAFNYDMSAASLETALICEDESRTQQQFKDECDINTIIERFGLDGQIPQDARVPLQSEFLEVFDYQSALNQLIEADEAFMAYPASIRARFQNDPQQFLAYISDPEPDDEKKAELRKWNLLEPERPVPGPIEVRVIADPSDAGKTA